LKLRKLLLRNLVPMRFPLVRHFSPVTPRKQIHRFSSLPIADCRLLVVDW
jgi:hypothetical protein